MWVVTVTDNYPSRFQVELLAHADQSLSQDLVNLILPPQLQLQAVPHAPGKRSGYDCGFL